MFANGAPEGSLFPTIPEHTPKPYFIEGQGSCINLPSLSKGALMRFARKESRHPERMRTRVQNPRKTGQFKMPVR